MKTSLRKILTFVIVLCVAFIGFIGTAKVNAATQTYSYTFTAKTVTKEGSVELGEESWNVAYTATVSAYWGYDNTKGQQFGSSNNPYTALSLTSSTSFDDIESIVINTSGASSTKAKLEVYVGGVQVGSQVSLTTSATEYRFTPNASGTVQFSFSQTSSKAIYIKSIEIAYSPKIADTDVEAAMTELNSVNSSMSLSYMYTYLADSEEKDTATITFDNVAKRTSFSTTQQVWNEQGLTVTNDKANSTTAVADYSNPVRLYKNSTVTIEGEESFSEIVFACSGTSYLITDAASTVDGAYKVNGTTVTLALNESVKSVTLTMPIQVRLNSLTVKYDEKVIVDTLEFEDVEFRIRFGVDSSLNDIAEMSKVEEVGIQVTANGKTVQYSELVKDEQENVVVENGNVFIVVSLGDLLNNIQRFAVDFTVEAYAVIDGKIYVSESSSTNSVSDLVKTYYEAGYEVEHLYKYLLDKGYIA